MKESTHAALNGLKPAMIMVVVQVAFAGVNVFYKLATNDGMSVRVLIAYRFSFAAAFIVPLALVYERKSRPKLTWMVVLQSFLCGFFGGTLAQNLYLEGLILTSATFASAMANLIPAVTFIMSVAFGLERLGFKTIEGKAKVGGTLIGLGGAMLLTFYKGADVNIWSTGVDLLHHGPHRRLHSGSLHGGGAGNRVMGSLLAVGGCLSFALWLIIQANMGKKYPSYYSCTALMSVMASIQSVGLALCTEERSQWRLGWNIRLLTVAYSGIVGSGLMMSLMSWCVHQRGPLFVSVFNPLMLLLVALLGSLMLNEKLHLGSVLGGILIVCGLYVVLWGKSREIQRMTQVVPSSKNSHGETIQIVVLGDEEIPGKNINEGGKDRDDDNNGFMVGVDHPLEDIRGKIVEEGENGSFPVAVNPNSDEDIYGSDGVHGGVAVAVESLK